MNKALYFLPLGILALAAAGTVPGASQAQQGSTQLRSPMEMGMDTEELAFEAADTSGDNLVSEGEFARDAAAGFSGLDANLDRKLTPQELGPHDPAAFKRVDANGDGVLTFDEVMKFKMKAFNAADTNDDGKLSFDEMTKSVADR